MISRLTGALFYLMTTTTGCSGAPTQLLNGANERLTSTSWTWVESAPFGADRTIHKFTLANGLTLLMMRDASAPVFAYHSWFRVGSRHEEEGKTGIAHLFEHMMFKATKSMGDGEFDKLMERRGAQTNAATWVDWTYYHEALPATADNLSTTIKLEADRMVNLVLNKKQLESEREVVKNERLYRVDDDPDGKMYEELWHLALDGHPYGWPTIGWMRDIEAISVKDCQEFYRRYYSPNNVVLVVVGDVDPVELLVELGTHYGPLAAQEIPEEAPVALSTRSAPVRKELTLPVQNERLLIGYPGPAINDASNVAMDVAMEVLFGGDSSRLHRLMVSELEVASSVDGSVPHFKLSGLIEVVVSLKSGKTAEEAEKILLEQLALMGTAGPTDAELEKAKNQLEASVYQSSYSANAIAGRLGHYEVTAGDFQAFQRSLDAMRHVDAEAVKAVVTRWLAPEQRSTIVVRPAEKE